MRCAVLRCAAPCSRPAVEWGWVGVGVIYPSAEGADYGGVLRDGDEGIGKLVRFGYDYL